MALVLDAGAILAAERGDRDVVALIKGELQRGHVPITHGGIVGQVWRGGARQARIAALLDGTLVVPLDAVLGRRAGALLARARKADVIDAALVLLAHEGDTVLSSDAGDLRALARAADLELDIVHV